MYIADKDEKLPGHSQEGQRGSNVHLRCSLQKMCTPGLPCFMGGSWEGDPQH